ncbi:MAG TPA: hypothetical protein VFS92_07995 [Planctomycetota bacterium]|nr:hypothetical protein [Planctomycetota bacterium]
MIPRAAVAPWVVAVLVAGVAILVVQRVRSERDEARGLLEAIDQAKAEAMYRASGSISSQMRNREAETAGAEAARERIRTLEAELHAARSRAAQLLIEKSEAEAAAAVARRELEEARSPATAKPAPAAEPAPAPPAPEAATPEPKRTPLLEPKATALGPTAVTDPGQVKKLVDGLNSLLAGAEEPEAWSITSAEAVDGDRLVRAVVEARARGGGLSRSFRAEEVRFTLVPSSRSLEVRFREGAVTYSGERTISFPGGRYAAVLAVDPTAFRNAAHPLVAVPSN